MGWVEELAGQLVGYECQAVSCAKCITVEARRLLPSAPSTTFPIPWDMRARDLGIIIGHLPTGPHNAITDVGGVRVGHTTLITAHRLPHDRLVEVMERFHWGRVD